MKQKYHINNLRGEEKKKFSFKDKKKNIIHSLKEVEYFLNNLKKAYKSIELYKIIKK